MTITIPIPKSGSQGPDRLVGGPGPDWMYGHGGDDVLLGEGGNDYLVGGPGADLIDGGEGADTASYFDASAAVTVNLGLARISHTEEVRSGRR
jgi:Ca2+-binding RTX toxin-like protein